MELNTVLCIVTYLVYKTIVVVWLMTACMHYVVANSLAPKFHSSQ